MFDVIYTIRTRFCKGQTCSFPQYIASDFLSSWGFETLKQKKMNEWIGVAFVEQLSPFKRGKYLIMGCQARLSSVLKGAQALADRRRQLDPRAFIFSSVSRPPHPFPPRF